MKKLLIKIGVVVVLLLVAAFLVGAMFLGSLIKKGVETVGPTLTKTDVKLGSASVSVLSGSGSMKNFVLGNPEGYKADFAVRVGRAELGVKPRSVLSDKIHVTVVRVESPEIAFEGNVLSPKNSNLGKIMDNLEAATGGAAGQSKPAAESQGPSKKLQVDEFLVTGGRIHVTTVLTAGKPVTLPLPDIHLTNLGQGPEGITAAELTRKALGAVLEGTLSEIAKNAAHLAQDAAKAAEGAVKGAKDAGGKAVKKVGGLLKRN